MAEPPQSIEEEPHMENGTPLAAASLVAAWTEHGLHVGGHDPDGALHEAGGGAADTVATGSLHDSLHGSPTQSVPLSVPWAGGGSGGASAQVSLPRNAV